MIEYILGFVAIAGVVALVALVALVTRATANARSEAEYNGFVHGVSSVIRPPAPTWTVTEVRYPAVPTDQEIAAFETAAEEAVQRRIFPEVAVPRAVYAPQRYVLRAGCRVAIVDADGQDLVTRRVVSAEGSQAILDDGTKWISLAQGSDYRGVGDLAGCVIRPVVEAN